MNKRVLFSAVLAAMLGRSTAYADAPSTTMWGADYAQLISAIWESVKAKTFEAEIKAEKTGVTTYETKSYDDVIACLDIWGAWMEDTNKEGSIANGVTRFNAINGAEYTAANISKWIATVKTKAKTLKDTQDAEAFVAIDDYGVLATMCASVADKSFSSSGCTHSDYTKALAAIEAYEALTEDVQLKIVENPNWDNVTAENVNTLKTTLASEMPDLIAGYANKLIGDISILDTDKAVRGDIKKLESWKDDVIGWAPYSDKLNRQKDNLVNILDEALDYAYVDRYLNGLKNSIYVRYDAVEELEGEYTLGNVVAEDDDPINGIVNDNYDTLKAFSEAYNHLVNNLSDEELKGVKLDKDRMKDYEEAFQAMDAALKVLQPEDEEEAEAVSAAMNTLHEKVADEDYEYDIEDFDALAPIAEKIAKLSAEAQGYAKSAYQTFDADWKIVSDPYKAEQRKELASSMVNDFAKTGTDYDKLVNGKAEYTSEQIKGIIAAYEQVASEDAVKAENKDYSTDCPTALGKVGATDAAAVVTLIKASNTYKGYKTKLDDCYKAAVCGEYIDANDAAMTAWNASDAHKAYVALAANKDISNVKTEKEIEAAVEKYDDAVNEATYLGAYKEDYPEETSNIYVFEGYRWDAKNKTVVTEESLVDGEKVTKNKKGEIVGIKDAEYPVVNADLAAAAQKKVANEKILLDSALTAAQWLAGEARIDYVVKAADKNAEFTGNDVATLTALIAEIETGDYKKYAKYLATALDNLETALDKAEPDATGVSEAQVLAVVFGDGTTESWKDRRYSWKDLEALVDAQLEKNNFYYVITVDNPKKLDVEKLPKNVVLKTTYRGNDYYVANEFALNLAFPYKVDHEIHANKVSIYKEKSQAKLSVDNAFSSVFLPFDLTTDHLDELKEQGATMYWIGGVTEKDGANGKPEVVFTCREKTEAATAFKPYLLKGAADNLELSEVTLKKTTSSYTPLTYNANGIIYLFSSSNGLVTVHESDASNYTVSVAGTEKPAADYVLMPNSSSLAGMLAPIRNTSVADRDDTESVPAGTLKLTIVGSRVEYVKSFRFVIEGEDDATAISTVNAALESGEGIYTIGGQKLNAITKPGLYIVGGKKVMVK